MCELCDEELASICINVTTLSGTLLRREVVCTGCAWDLGIINQRDIDAVNTMTDVAHTERKGK